MERREPRITYLFGAGASAKKLPCIKELPDRINAAKLFIQNNYRFEHSETVKVNGKVICNKLEAHEFIVSLLDELHRNAKEHSTVDTYAKKLYLNKSQIEDHKLRYALALYFSVEQKISGNDDRYETFLVSILDEGAFTLPSYIKILSWNYDRQLEIAYGKIIGKEDIGFKLLSGDYSEVKKDRFNYIQLNGSCAMTDRYRRKTNLIKVSSPAPDNNELDQAMAYAYAHFFQNQQQYEAYPDLRFAWYRRQDEMDGVKEVYADTEILVVIGYSFPFFNREVDREIIRNMPGLQKIYIQDKYPEDIKSKFLSILPDYKERKIDLITVSNIEDFFLPPEL